MYSELKEEKVADYIKLHAEPWPELIELIGECNVHNYSISIRGNQLFTYYEYTGDDYDSDMDRMDTSPVMIKWRTFSKPCFKRDEEGNAYKDLQEIFYCR